MSNNNFTNKIFKNPKRNSVTKLNRLRSVGKEKMATPQYAHPGYAAPQQGGYPAPVGGQRVINSRL